MGLVISNTSWFQVVTGLLVAEVNVNTMSELGSGGVSLVCLLQTDTYISLVMSCFDFLMLFWQVSMAKRTLGSFGVQVAS